MTYQEYTSAAEMVASYAAIRRRWGLSPDAKPVKRAERGKRLYGAPIGPAEPPDWGVLRARRNAIMSLDERPDPTLQEIKEVVAAIFDIQPRSIDGGYVSRRESKAKFVYYWIARNFTSKSLPEIGRRAGGKHHTTVMNGIKRVNAARLRDPVHNEFEPQLSQALSAMRLG